MKVYNVQWTWLPKSGIICSIKGTTYIGITNEQKVHKQVCSLLLT